MNCINSLVSIFSLRTKYKSTYFDHLPNDLLDMILIYINNIKDLDSILIILNKINNDYPENTDLQGSHPDLWRRLFLLKFEIQILLNNKELQFLYKIKYIYDYSYIELLNYDKLGGSTKYISFISSYINLKIEYPMLAGFLLKLLNYETITSKLLLKGFIIISEFNFLMEKLTGSPKKNSRLLDIIKNGFDKIDWIDNDLDLHRVEIIFDTKLTGCNRYSIVLGSLLTGYILSHVNDINSHSYIDLGKIIQREFDNGHFKELMETCYPSYNFKLYYRMKISEIELRECLKIILQQNDHEKVYSFIYQASILFDYIKKFYHKPDKKFLLKLLGAINLITNSEGEKVIDIVPLKLIIKHVLNI